MSVPRFPKEEEDRLRAMSIVEIKKGLLLGKWGSPDYKEYRLAQCILEEKIAEEENNRFNKQLELSRYLVKATWGLVVVTALLVLATFIK